MTVKIGSLFSGIGGFELGLERSWVNAETIWQVEKKRFCQRILSKHWPKSTIYNNVKHINKNNVEPVDVLIGGFPCQSVSLAGKLEGLENGEKSGLWWEMWRIISDLRPRVIIMENVANVIRVGGADVVGSLAKIGYNCEWTIISAKQFGAPHLRERWFCVGYPQSMFNRGWITPNTNGHGDPTEGQVFTRRTTAVSYVAQSTTNTNSVNKLRAVKGGMLEETKSMWLHSRGGDSQNNGSHHGRGYWQTAPSPSPFCRVDDGLSNRVARLEALGNAIVPQCSQWVGDQILKSGLLDDLLEDK